MGEKMRPIAFDNLVKWVVDEYNNKKSIFGIRENKFYKNTSGTYIEIFGNKISTPIGPAAGPNSQLAQNIVAAYLTGSRFFEVKTVQIMDGAELAKCVARPCINAEDECYNVEWSTELYVHEAFDEYVKAWFLNNVLAKELGIAKELDFAFNMSVGYDLEGIKSEKINNYIMGMKDASSTPIFKQCKQFLLDNINLFKNVTKDDIEAISPVVANSITISTLHGCPPDEIERIATYLLKEKNIHTFIKCNPTLLGYEFARKTLDDMGYGYIAFDDKHFKGDLKFDDAISMFKRLMPLAEELKLEFGVKITNTFPVDIKANELPGQEMYMSGRSLFPLSINVANKISKALDGKLQISYSGGADHFNINKIYETGIKPITVATTILKPGGYERLTQLAKDLEPVLDGKFKQINVKKLTELAEGVVNEKRHLKTAREAKDLKVNSKLNLFDCFISPCKEGGCPINQQIPEYLNLVANGNYDEAFRVIDIDNALPAITGAICDHQCQNKCVRTDYDDPLQIRAAKYTAVVNAETNFINNMTQAPIQSDKKAVVIGAGPAGVAVAYYLRRNGMDVTVLEKNDKPMGIVKYLIPEFRISDEFIQKDFDKAAKAGVNFKFNQDPNYNVEELKKQYDYVVIATGAWLEGRNPLKQSCDSVKGALEFLQSSKAGQKIDLGKRVAVVGAGDVAMDCARVAKKTAGVEEVCIVYRRTKEFMPAQQEEIELALEDGVQIMELLNPVTFDGKTLVCEKQTLTEERDARGRKMMKGTGETVEIPFDYVINSVGARVDASGFKQNNITLNDRDYAKLTDSLETNIKNVYVAGDCKAGASTIVKAMADGKVIAKAILANAGLAHDFVKYTKPLPVKALYERKGTLKEKTEKGRCLACDQICEICNDVCPNRANVYVVVNDSAFRLNHQILHIDGMCNECGNCGVFCPHQGNPYKDKITLFWTHEDFEDSTNVGFLKVSDNEFLVRREDMTIVTYKLGDNNVSYEIAKIIDTVINDYSYYLI